MIQELRGTKQDLRGHMARLKVRVSPGARDDTITGWRDDVLCVRVRAPAERGKANTAACRLLARLLGIAPTAITIVLGASSREKLVQIDGLDDEDLRVRLIAALS